jgi:hypothetical protein
MTLQDLMTRASGVRAMRLPACPQCGDMLLAPLLAQHVSAGLVHNHWVCEACGHSFRRTHAFEATAFEEELA